MREQTGTAPTAEAARAEQQEHSVAVGDHCVKLSRAACQSRQAIASVLRAELAFRLPDSEYRRMDFDGLAGRILATRRAARGDFLPRYRVRVRYNARVVGFEWWREATLRDVDPRQITVANENGIAAATIGDMHVLELEAEGGGA